MPNTKSDYQNMNSEFFWWQALIFKLFVMLFTNFMRKNYFIHLLGNGSGDAVSYSSEPRGQSSSCEDRHICSSISRELCWTHSSLLCLASRSFPRILLIAIDHSLTFPVSTLTCVLVASAINSPVLLTAWWSLGREVFSSWFPLPLI